jgi:hypothetical protein
MGEHSEGIAASSGGGEVSGIGSQAHHVGISTQEDRHCSKGKVGEVEGGEKETVMTNSPQFKGLFDLQSPQDLLKKLCHDLERLTNSPRDQYAAFDFFVTARHMPEWVYPSEQNRKKRADLERSSPLLRVCAHIGDGSKHFQATALKHRSVQGSAVQEGAFDRAFQADAFQMDALIICFERDTAEALGVKEIDCVELARRVLEYWQDHFGNETRNTC